MRPEVFKERQTQEVIRFVREEYGDELEFLWPKFDTNAVWRNPVNRKWYGAILTVGYKKLGISREGVAEILDLRFDKGGAMEFARGIPGLLPGWHMNKGSWYSVVLDGTLEDAKIFELIDYSYKLVNEGK